MSIQLLYNDIICGKYELECDCGAAEMQRRHFTLPELLPEILHRNGALVEPGLE